MEELRERLAGATPADIEELLLQAYEAGLAHGVGVPVARTTLLWDRAALVALVEHLRNAHHAALPTLLTLE